MDSSVSPMNEEEASGGSNPASQSHPIMMSKVQAPRRRPDLLRRPRLVNFLHSHLDQKLIMISAAAGYGKTSLLVDFTNDTDLPVCWYTLDAFDRDLRVFLEYFIAAIAQRFPSFGKQSRDFIRQLPNLKGNLYAIVATLVQEIYTAIPEYFILILDDHQTVENQEQINEFLDMFLQYVDENCHLVIASRTLPALPNLSLLVARRQAAGLSIDELRFTPEELQSLVQTNYGMSISVQQAEELTGRSGGWITGLLLTVIPELSKKSQAASVGGQTSLDLYDYFERQVLSQQTPELRDFLLATSVLDTFTAENCEQILGLEGSETQIMEILMRSLFTVTFDSDEQRLRYHDLFREFLISYLRKNDPARFHRLNLAAAEFYAQLGEWERALSRYLTLKEYTRAVETLERVVDRLFETGQWEALAYWIDALPQSIREECPDLTMTQAKILAEQGHWERALSILNSLENRSASEGNEALTAQVLATKGEIYRNQGKYTEASALSEKALFLAEADSPAGKSTLAKAQKNLGVCLIRQGEIENGQRSLLIALNLYEELGHRLNVGMIDHDLGLSCELDGDLNGAIKYYRAALEVWDRLGNLSAWANTLNGLGVVYYLQGKYEQSASLLSEATAKARQSRDPRIEAYALASLADLKRDLRAYPEAEEAYQLAVDLASQFKFLFLVTYCQDGLGNIARLQGDFNLAWEWMHKAFETSLDSGSPYQLGLTLTSKGILEYEQNSLEVARDDLERAIQALSKSGFVQLQSRAWLHRAQVEFLLGDKGKAFLYLENALKVASHLSYDQFLVVEGVRLQDLLRAGLQHGFGAEMPGILPRIWQRVQQEAARQPSPPVIRTQPKPSEELRIYAFGQPRVVSNGETVQWVVAKSRDLLFFLLQNPQGLTREQIGAQFWPEHSPEKLESAFRSTLYRLRRDLVRECVVFENGLYRFNHAYPYWYDVEAFEEALRRVESCPNDPEKITALEEALDLYQGNYLQVVYENWCTLEREHLRVQYQTVLETLANHYARLQSISRAIEYFQRLLREDPYRESAHRELMRCYSTNGDRASAIRQYKTCAELFGKELGLDLTPETQALYHQIIQ